MCQPTYTALNAIMQFSFWFWLKFGEYWKAIIECKQHLVTICEEGLNLKRYFSLAGYAVTWVLNVIMQLDIIDFCTVSNTYSASQLNMQVGIYKSVKVVSE